MITPHLFSGLKLLGAWIAFSSIAAMAAPPPELQNPFRRFTGEWTLKDNRWSQNWGQGDQVITITGHHTVSKPINTVNSILTVVDRPEPQGHISWAYNPAIKTVHHLSSFGTARTGVGEGTVSDSGDLRLKVSFSDEVPGTYRIYTYRWISDDEYELLSKQYDAQDKPTGLFYGGAFIRIRHDESLPKDRAGSKTAP